MLNKLKAFYAVFEAGKSVANPAAWKMGQVTGGIVAAFLGACLVAAKVMGYDIPLDNESLVQIGGAIVAVFGLFNAGTTVATTKTLGVRPEAVAQQPESQPESTIQPKPVRKPKANVQPKPEDNSPKTESYAERDKRVFGDY